MKGSSVGEVGQEEDRRHREWGSEIRPRRGRGRGTIDREQGWLERAGWGWKQGDGGGSGWEKSGAAVGGVMTERKS